MAYDNNDNRKNLKKNRRTMGLVVATAVAAVPLVGCTSDSQSALSTDAGAQADATAETNVPEDASANDVSPDGVRG